MELKGFRKIQIKYSEDLKALIDKHNLLTIANKYTVYQIDELMKEICSFGGNCISLSMYLCALLLIKGLDAYICVIKPIALKSMDHHAVVVIFRNKNKTFEILVLDPMAYCVRKLPWNWKLSFSNIIHFEKKLGHIIVLFNDKEAYVRS